MRRIALFMVVLVVILSGAISRGIARAQTDEPTATELGAGARRAHDSGRIKEAIEGYARAYQISGDPEFLFSLAETHREAGQDTDALRTFQTYLRRNPQGPHHESAETQIKELEAKIKQSGQANAVAPPRASPPARLAVAPPARPLPPPAPLAPLPAAAPSVPPLAMTPVPGADLTREAKPPARQEDGPPLPRWVPWAAAVTTVALGTAAIVSGLSASGRFDDLKNTCGQTNQGCAPDQVSDVRSRAHRANLLWVLTSVAAVGTGVTVYVNASAAGTSGLWSF